MRGNIPSWVSCSQVPRPCVVSWVRFFGVRRCSGDPTSGFIYISKGKIRHNIYMPYVMSDFPFWRGKNMFQYFLFLMFSWPQASHRLPHLIWGGNLWIKDLRYTDTFCQQMLRPNTLLVSFILGQKIRPKKELRQPGTRRKYVVFGSVCSLSFLRFFFYTYMTVFGYIKAIL